MILYSKYLCPRNRVSGDIGVTDLFTTMYCPGVMYTSLSGLVVRFGVGHRGAGRRSSGRPKGCPLGKTNTETKGYKVTDIIPKVDITSVE